MNEDVEKLYALLEEYGQRIDALEKQLVGREGGGLAVPSRADVKTKTLRELAKGKKLTNGREKIAVIVGYHERVLGTLIHKEAIRDEWKQAKFDGTYKTNLLDDADGLYIRVAPSGECDLTQKGEEFFDALTNSDVSG